MAPPTPVTDVRETRHRELPLGARVHEAICVARGAGLPVLLEGPTGIGKSQIVAQTASALGIEARILDLSLLEPSDLVGLPSVQDGRTTYAPPRMLPMDGAGILLFEELNRAETFMQHTAMQLLTARRLQQYELPPLWTIVAAINPENDEYLVNTLDKALRARFVVLRVRADRELWLEWARANAVHPAIRSVVARHPGAFDSTPPRSWENASRALHLMEANSSLQETLKRDVLGGILPSFEWVEIVVKTIGDLEGAPDIDPRLIFRGYREHTQLRRFVATNKALGRTDALDALVARVRELLRDSLARLVDEGQFRLEEFDAFLEDLPGDLAEQLRREFAGNPAAARCVQVPLDGALKRYRTSSLRAFVQGVSAQRSWHHVSALMHALAAELRERARSGQLEELRQDRTARKNLGLLIEHAGAELALPLTKSLAELEIVPVFDEPKEPSQ